MNNEANKEQNIYPLKSWENLTFADNFIFCKVLEDNPDITKKLLELLLDIQIEKIEPPASEKQIKVEPFARAARFDVYVKDGNGRCFDIEIQTCHFSNLAKRARYYQGLMAVDNLQTGKDYDSLKESFVIFLCLGDAIGRKLPVYTFRYRADEDSSILMNDGTVNIFFNAKQYAKMKSQKLSSFFEYLCGQEQEPRTEFTNEISRKVGFLKMDSMRRREYLTWEQELKIQAKYLAEDMAKDIAEDMAKDIAEDMAKDMAKDMAENMAKEKVIETAKNLLKMNLSAEQVSKATEIPLEQIIELQNSFKLEDK